MFCQKCGTQNPDTGKFCRSCGTNISGLQSATTHEVKLNEVYIDRRGRVRSNNPDDLWSSGLRSVIMGLGFLIVSGALFITNVAGGHAWWWAMLFPAFTMLANGISQIAKANRLQSKQAVNFEGNFQNQIPQGQNNSALPPTQNEYISPTDSRYKTGDLVPPSVVEGTTRHLELNKEGETMTLPQKK